jgi:hypothetical protein
MPSVGHLAKRGLPYQLLVEQAQVNIREMRERDGGYVGLTSRACPPAGEAEDR